MASVHPQTVIWELLRAWEPNHKVPVLRLIEGELRCFPYYNFDLASLCATLASEIEDTDSEVRSASRDCVRLLLNIIRDSPVPTEEDKAVRLLMRNPAVNWDTLMSVGISGKANNFLEDSFQSECNTTARSSIFSKSTLVPDSSFTSSSKSFQETYQLQREGTTPSDMFVAKTPSNSKFTRHSVHRYNHIGFPSVPSECLYEKTSTGVCNGVKSNKNTLEIVSVRKAHSSAHKENVTFQQEKTVVSRNCEITPNFTKEKNGRQVSDGNFVQERSFMKEVSRQLNISDKVEDQLVLSSPIMPEQNDDGLLTTPINKRSGILSHCHDGDDASQREDVYCFHGNKGVSEESDAKNERGDWNDLSAEDQLLSESDCTLVSVSSYDPKEHTMDDKPTRPFLKKGSKRPSTIFSNHGPPKGREIPRTPQNFSVVQEKELWNGQQDTPQDSTAVQKSELLNEQQETKSNKKASTTKLKSTVTNKKRPVSLPAKVVNPEPTSNSDDIQDECEEEQVSSYSEGQFSKCPWRQELVFASKGVSLAWVKDLEKGVSNMQPFPSTEAAEKGLKKVLEDLEGKPWRPKEAALVELVRFSLHHPSLLEEELGRVISALCAELQNQKSSISGRAVVVVGLLFQTMGKKMENKLRVIVDALIKKSRNRTFSAHLQIVTKSLSRIVSSSNPHKVVMAFINEESRNANKASREMGAQFLCVLTETLGAAGCLSSSSLAGPVIRCAANFATDRSPLTRYCGKRMFHVLVKHPKFDALKDKNLDVGIALNLKTLLQSIREKGVDEEPLPINFIK